MLIIVYTFSLIDYDFKYSLVLDIDVGICYCFVQIGGMKWYAVESAP